MPRPVTFTPSALRQWVNLSGDVRSRIKGRLDEYAATGKGDVKRLKGHAGTRLRIGDWRVIFTEAAGGIIVGAVGHRRDIYD